MLDISGTAGLKGNKTVKSITHDCVAGTMDVVLYLRRVLCREMEEKNFIRAIEQISKGNQSAADVVAELGTMKDGGILPGSYPESAEPDDDFLMLSDAKVSDGDRVLPDLDRCRGNRCDR